MFPEVDRNVSVVLGLGDDFDSETLHMIGDFALFFCDKLDSDITALQRRRRRG